MTDAGLITVLSSAGVAGVFCILFILGHVVPRSVVDDVKAERDYERARADAERDRADAAVAAATAARDVLAALQAGVVLGHQTRELRGTAVVEGLEHES